MQDAATTSRPRQVARMAWPMALVLLAVPVAVDHQVDRYFGPELIYALLVIVPVLLAVLWASYAIGGRRGAAVGAALLGLVAYWAWWFGWRLYDVVAGFSFPKAAGALADASDYHLSLALLLWPFVLVAIAATALVARRRGWRVWTALGLLSLVLVVAAVPSRGAWSDGCNTRFGATPLLTRSLVTPLMDAGIGVLPGGFQTQAYCGNVGDREWMPFWRGDDGLPP